MDLSAKPDIFRPIWNYLQKSSPTISPGDSLLDSSSHSLTGELVVKTESISKLEAQLDDLKQQNETLRVNIQALQQKPEKIDQRRLTIMDSAVTTMREQAPGFAQAWEKSMREAEDEMESAEGGLKKLMRKVVPSFRSNSSATDVKDAKLIETNTDQ